MNESPFATTGRILAEHPNMFDLLRIIAAEAKLDNGDCQALRNAADELEFAQRALIDVQAQLIDTRRQLVACNERLLEINRAAGKPPSPYPSLSTGWLRTELLR